MEGTLLQHTMTGRFIGFLLIVLARYSAGNALEQSDRPSPDAPI